MKKFSGTLEKKLLSNTFCLNKTDFTFILTNKTDFTFILSSGFMNRHEGGRVVGVILKFWVQTFCGTILNWKICFVLYKLINVYHGDKNGV